MPPRAGVALNGTSYENDGTPPISSGGGIAGVTLLDEGIELPNPATGIDFRGVGVSVSGSGDTKIVTITGSGGGSGSDAFVIVAAQDTPPDLKPLADFVAPGTNGDGDEFILQAAFDQLITTTVGQGTLIVLEGTYRLADTWGLGHTTTSTTTVRCHVDAQRGANITWMGTFTPGQDQAIVKVESSDIVISHLRVTGKSATTDVSTGIAFGGPDSIGGRWSKAVYRSRIENCVVSSCRTGVSFEINADNSAGDNIIEQGFITNCQVGVKSVGFTNRIYGTTIAVCNIGIDVSHTRLDSKIEVFGATINNWGQAAIWVRGGIGSLFDTIWMEHTDDTKTPTDALRFGQHTSFGDPVTSIAYDTMFTGTTTIHCNPSQTAAIRFVNAGGAIVDAVRLSTNGYAPKGGAIRQETPCTGTNNKVRRLRLYPGASGFNSFRSGNNAAKHKLTPTGITAALVSDVIYGTATFASAHNLQAGQEIKISGLTPADYNGIFRINNVINSTSVRFRMGVSTVPAAASGTFTNAIEYYGVWAVNASNTRLIVEEIPDGLDTVGGRTIGHEQPHQGYDYTHFKETTNGKTTYYVKSRHGHVVDYSTDNTNVVGLRNIFDTVCKTNTSHYFGPHAYVFATDPLGKRDHGVFSNINGLTLAGAGMWETYIVNDSDAPEDTEPLSFTDCDRITIKDMTVQAGGSVRMSSDAIDFDGSCDTLLENVRVNASRGRGIVFDGKDTGYQAMRGTLRNCIVDGTGGTIPSEGYEFLSAQFMYVDNCKAIGCQGHGFQEAKSSPTAGQPNKPNSHNRWVNIYADMNGLDGMNLQSSQYTTIIAPILINNSQAAGSHDGLRIATADGIVSEGIRIIGGFYGDLQVTKTQRYGINFAPTLAGEVVDALVVAPSYDGNSLAGFNSSATTGNVVVISTASGGSGGGLTTEEVDDRVNALLVAGSGMTKVYDDNAGTITLSSTGGGAATTGGFSFIIDGNGEAITAGIKGEVTIPFDCTITGWQVVADQPGTISITVDRSTYAAYPTFTTISGTEKPSLSSAQKNTDLTLTTWAAVVSAYSTFKFTVDSSPSSVTRVTLAIFYERT